MNNKAKNIGKKTIVVVLIGGTLASVLLPVASVVFAEESVSESSVVTTTDIENTSAAIAEDSIHKPIVVVGGGLTNVEVEETIKLLGFENTSELNYLTISGDDLSRYLGESGGNTASMISSVLVTPNEDEGLILEIKTPDDITLITPNQYKKAALNLGIDNVTIDIASVRPVTGESALTGLYKATESLGTKISEGQMAVSNAETELFADVTENNKENADYNPDEITQLVSELEKDIQELTEKQKGMLTEEEIADLVQKAIDEKGLGDFINQGNINLLIDTLNLYQGTPELISNEEITKNTKEFTENIGKQLDAGLNYLVEQVPNSDELLENSKNIFQKLWSGIVSFFGSIFGGSDEEVTTEKESDSLTEEEIVGESATPKDENELTESESVGESVAPKEETNESNELIESETVDEPVSSKDTKDTKTDMETQSVGNGLGDAESATDSNDEFNVQVEEGLSPAVESNVNE